jgi:hypothetical protein
MEKYLGKSLWPWQKNVSKKITNVKKKSLPLKNILPVQ